MRKATVGGSELAAGGTTKFVHGGPDVVRDLDGNGSTIADYLNAPGIDETLRQTISGTVSYYLTDHLGTTRILADASGSSVSTLAYDSFGNVRSGPAATRYTYSGREIDPDTGLMYYRARWYEPQVGRFLSEDPIGFSGGDSDLYAYVRENPVNLIDPTGMQIRSDRNWNEGNEDPITHKTLHNDFKQAAGMATDFVALKPSLEVLSLIFYGSTIGKLGGRWNDLLPS